MTDDEKIQLEKMIEERALEPLGMGIQPDISDKYPSFRISKVMGPQWEDYEYVDWPHYSVTMQVVARPKPHLRVVKENKKMKLTKAKLKQIIKEEIESVLTETIFDAIAIENEAATVEDIVAGIERTLERNAVMKGTIIYQLNRARHIPKYKEKADAIITAMGWTDEAANHWSRAK